MLMRAPISGGIIDVSDEKVAQFEAHGFHVIKPKAEEPKAKAPARRKRTAAKKEQ